jgi:hypothetical protein
VSASNNPTARREPAEADALATKWVGRLLTRLWHV